MWVRSSETATENIAESVKDFVDSVYTCIEDAVGMQFADAEGAGLFTWQSLLNHSCQPNAEVCSSTHKSCLFCSFFESCLIFL